MYLNSILFALGFSITSAFSFSARAAEDLAFSANNALTQKNCSGQISDLNCYQDVIKKTAHLANVRDGYVPSQVEDFRNENFKKSVFEGQKIIVDTEDQESCQQVIGYINGNNIKESQKSLRLDDLCTHSNNPEDRYRTVTVMWETSEEYLTPLKLNFLKNSENNIVNDTRNLSYLMLAGAGIIWALPESISKWNKKDVTTTGFFSKWKNNVTQGPVIDHDDPVVNYVGHPISGAAYYMVARTQGFSAMQSFGYSVLMSTFFWEFGFEAFAEKPSIQDLIVTPVIGSILGEVFYNWSLKIEANNGKVLNSKGLGSVILFLLNPAGELSQKINHLLGSRVVRKAETDFVMSRKTDHFFPGLQSNYIGIYLKFSF